VNIQALIEWNCVIDLDAIHDLESGILS